MKTNSQAGHYHSPLMCRHPIITRQSLEGAQHSHLTSLIYYLLLIIISYLSIITRQSLEGAQHSYLTSFILICQILTWRVKLHLTHHASVLTGSPKLFLCVWGSSKLVSLFLVRQSFQQFRGKKHLTETLNIMLYSRSVLCLV